MLDSYRISRKHILSGFIIAYLALEIYFVIFLLYSMLVLDRTMLMLCIPALSDTTVIENNVQKSSAHACHKSILPCSKYVPLLNFYLNIKFVLL